VKPEVSVVIPSFERPAQTVRAVRSALAQAGTNLEVVVVDDASPSPLELPREILSDGRVRLVRLPKNGGPAAARNAGIETSDGDYIAFLDSDDFFLPDTLSARLAFVRSVEGAGPLFAAAPVWRWIPGRSAILAKPIAASDPKVLASGCWYFPGSTGLFSKTTWNRVGPLDSSLRRLEDLDFGLRLANAKGVLIVAPMPAAVVRRSAPAGLGAVSAAADHILAGIGQGDPTIRRRLAAYLAVERANSAYGEGRYGGVAANLIRSLLLRPRLSIHQNRFWDERPASPEEFARIEQLAVWYSATS
jgi:glycosyltransferase involved in cell wall biosynthesis